MRCSGRRPPACCSLGSNTLFLGAKARLMQRAERLLQPRRGVAPHSTQDAVRELAVLRASRFYEGGGLFPCLCSWKQGQIKKKKKSSFYDPRSRERAKRLKASKFGSATRARLFLCPPVIPRNSRVPWRRGQPAGCPACGVPPSSSRTSRARSSEALLSVCFRSRP